MKICHKEQQKSEFSKPLQKLMQIRYHKGAGTKMNKCLLESFILLVPDKIYDNNFTFIVDLSKVI